MFDRSLVTSGFDTETLVSESYLTHLLLAQIEAGELPLEIAILDPNAGVDANVILHPPTKYERLYDVSAGVTLPDPVDGSFNVFLKEDGGSPVASLFFRPDGNQLASGSWDGAVRIWDLNTRRDVVTKRNHESSATCVAFSPDGSRLAFGTLDGVVRIIDADSGDELAEFSGHAGPVFGISFHPDGSSVASCSADHTIRIWNATDGNGLQSLTDHTAMVFSLDFSPDGAQLVSGSLDGTVRLWDLVGTAQSILLVDGDGAANVVGFSPDGARIAVGSSSGTLGMFNAANTAEEWVVSEHEDAITCLAFSPDGTRLVSGSRDRTVKVHDVASGAHSATFEGHRKPVLSVAFHPSGSTVASGSEETHIRIWNPQTAREESNLRVPFLELLVFASVTDNLSGQTLSKSPAGILVDLHVEADNANGGLEIGHQLRLSFVRLNNATATALTSSGIDVSSVETELRRQVDRMIDLGLARGQAVQQIRMRKFDAEDQNSLGFYVDLALRSGPEPNAYLPPRGQLALAQDFRSSDSHLAFSTSPGLFSLLGPDLKFQRAVETSPGSGNYEYPLRKDFADPESEEIGKIKGMSVGPEMITLSNQPPIPSGRLSIDASVEYQGFGANVQLFLEPNVKDDGLVDWDMDVDVDLGLLATLLVVVGGIVISLLFSPVVGWGSAAMIGTFLGLAVLKGLVVESQAAKAIEQRTDEDAVASFVDALPFRVPAATRRWDPFYRTHHEVVIPVDQVVIDQRGIAFEGVVGQGDLFLGKTPEPLVDVVIRDEQRDASGAVSALRYRVSDYPDLEVEFQAIAPGTDRLPFTRFDAAADPDLLSLTLDQVADRIEGNRLFAPITYTAERIHLVENQIDGLLCLSWRERAEERARLIEEFRAEKASDIRADEGDDIEADVVSDLEAQLGRPPTPTEIEAEFDARIDAFVNEEQATFESGPLLGNLDDAVEQVLRFDLAPEEMITLQRAGILMLDGVEIIRRRNPDGTTTDYYRDRPDSDPRDNLLELPLYEPPYAPPS